MCTDFYTVNVCVYMLSQFQLRILHVISLSSSSFGSWHSDYGFPHQIIHGSIFFPLLQINKQVKQRDL